jgi:transcription termination factor Rho
VRKRSDENVGETPSREGKPRERTRSRREPEENSAAPLPFGEPDPRRERQEPAQQGPPPGGQSDAQPSQQGGERRSARAEKRRRWQERRRQKRRQRRDGGDTQQAPAAAQRQGRSRPKSTHQSGRGRSEAERREVEGLLVLEQANHGHLRERSRGYLPSKEDVHVPPHLVQKLGLRDGALIKGSVRRGQGRNKWELHDVETVDGKDPQEVCNLPAFKSLTSIDPDFHYAVGDGSEEVSLMVVDLLCPVGRGQRGLIVAPPRSGKTILLQQFAKAVEKIYPEVHLMVLLVDERPEEATEWTRSLENGQVFVSTNDEMAKKHVELCEVVWRRCKRMVELGEDVILLLDSITRMGRAYNNVKGNSGKTMSGGIDSRALERPKQFFGAARNTETAGSLTILATALIETGSQMDRVIFEEFKGTGNMELVLSRKLSDRRIFPSIDIEKTGTRKEEKLHSKLRMHRVTVLRRVLMRMHWAEAMELLITKLDDVEKIDDFLSRFDVDPED